MEYDVQEFQDKLWRYYDQNARILPWRTPETDGQFDSYKILVSEMMLQQTQVKRVVAKYQMFLERFPTIDVLRSSQLSDVLALWSGLGYNRRAKYLHEAAKQLHSIKQPWAIEDLANQKGIGQNTAAAICVYSYNQAHVFIETNIRTVYLYHFFTEEENVEDARIIKLVEETLDYDYPREFYWALMDYGSHLKQQGVRNHRFSRHYKKQSKFEGSKRQIRGAVIRLLTQHDGTLPADELQRVIEDGRLNQVLADLEREKMIVYSNGSIHIG